MINLANYKLSTDDDKSYGHGEAMCSSIVVGFTILMRGGEYRMKIKGRRMGVDGERVGVIQFG